MLADCFLGFGQMLHAALVKYYNDSQNEDSVEHYLHGNDQQTYVIKYPGLATTTVGRLMESSQNCVDFFVDFIRRVVIAMDRHTSFLL